MTNAARQFIESLSGFPARDQQELLAQLLRRDTDHSDSEVRSRTYGLSNKGRLLVVVHTERRNNVRIISARKATRNEKSIYQAG